MGILDMFGFNPDEIQKKVKEASDNFQIVINHFNARFDKVEKLLLLTLNAQGVTNAEINAKLNSKSTTLQEGTTNV